MALKKKKKITTPDPALFLLYFSAETGIGRT
jgi:hypothetical protein